MRIAIVGAGFTGLSAAFRLQQQGHQVTIFEKDRQPGGLAIGYQHALWKWPLEQHYHHWFTSDTFVLDLAKEINHAVVKKRPKTSVYVHNKIYQLDSPLKFLTFPELPLIDRLRMTISLGLLRLNPFWKPLEQVKAVDILPKSMGKKAWELVWEPQLVNKMGKYATDIPLVWFWTRINKRTSSLTYPEGGFLSFAQHLATEITKMGGEIIYDAETTQIKDNNPVLINYTFRGEKLTKIFDAAIVTLPSFLFLRLTPQLPKWYQESLKKLQGLGATNMVMRMKKQFLKDGTYWLSICEKNSPILAIIEHTNLINRNNYHNEHIMYIGNYLDSSDPKYHLDRKRLLKLYDPILKKINPEYAKNIIDYEVFRAPFAQPIVPLNYSKLIPAMISPLKHIFLANMEQVYPWDRGTNYAVELGEKVAKLVTSIA